MRLLDRIPLEKRTARYQCAICLAYKGKVIKVVTGVCPGKIGYELRGGSGFGYDPLFITSKYKKTFAEVDQRLKHKISHRASAIKKTRKFLSGYIKRGL